MQKEIKIDDIAERLHFTIENTHKLLQIFYDSSANIISHLEENIQEKDYDKIYRYAHSLKGSAANLLFEDVAEICKEIEKAGKEEQKEFPYIQQVALAKQLIKDTKIV